MSEYGFYKKKKTDPQAVLRVLNRTIEESDFKRIHLLCGEEDYLRLQFRDKLTSAMGGVPGSLAYNRFTGRDISAAEIIDLAETLPFMAERRVILIEESGWYKDGNDEMADYISSGICESTCIVFCEKSVDKTRSMYKRTEKAGMVSEFIRMDENTLVSWIGSLMREQKLVISSADASYMVELVGDDMMALSAEISKLSAYCMDRGRVTREDIDIICSRRVEDRIFEMCEEVAMGRKTPAMRKYYDLLALRIDQIRILAMVTRHFNTLMKIKELDKYRRSDKLIAESVGHPEWSLKKYRAQNTRYSFEELVRIVEMCAETDYGIKSGRIDKEVAVETMMVRLLG